MKGRSLPLYPAKSLIGLLFVLVAMWYAASSQNNAAAYLLLFVLGSVFLVSIPRTVLSLSGLTAIPETAKPAFAGQEISIPVEITNRSRASRLGVQLSLPNCGSAKRRIDEIPAGKAARVTLRFPAPARGEYEIGKLRLTSRYPLGFLEAQRHVSTSQRFIVYPKPAGDPNLPVSRARSTKTGWQAELGEGDDFTGVRAYVPGESQRQIDWKAVARGQPLMTKQFAAEAEGVLYLDLAAAPFADLENRLCQLALWVIEAERAHRAYALRLGATTIGPSSGDQHFHQCLRALALFK